MSDQLSSEDQPLESSLRTIQDDALDSADEDSDDTLVVAPPSIRERLASAQRARANHARPSIDVAAHLTRREQNDTDDSQA
jgi:hypothetical protein